MGQVVNWFLLLIIFVFDPLAIAMVVAANFAFSQIKKKEPEVKMSVPDGMEFNKPYPIKEEVPDMREPLGEWADEAVIIEDKPEPEKEPEKDIYDEKPKETPSPGKTSYW